MNLDRNYLIGRVRSYLAESAGVKRAIIGPDPELAAATPVAASDFLSAGSLAGISGGVTVERIASAGELIAEMFRSGGKLLLCGNGGSAADCQHMAAELTSRLTRDFDRPALPAIALTTDTSFITAYANDVDFAGVFKRQVEALGRPGDALLAISTSGESPNIIAASEEARRRGLKTIALVGRGGKLAAIADIAIMVPSEKTGHIQEAHLAIEHVICSIVEEILFRWPQDASVPSSEDAV